jgi:hypothetical protein
MKKVIRLTENDLVRVIKRVIQEQQAVHKLLDKLSDMPVNKLSDVPEAPLWLNNLLQLEESEFSKYNEPEHFRDYLRKMGNKDLKIYHDELRRYVLDLQNSLSKLNKEIDVNTYSRLSSVGRRIRSLIDQLEKAGEPEWLIKFLNMEESEFRSFVRKCNVNRESNPNLIIKDLRNMGCVDFQRCLYEMKRYFNYYGKNSEEISRRIRSLENILIFCLNYNPKQPPLK